MVASPQKAFLDFFYIYSFYNTEKEMEDLRLNETELQKTVNKAFYHFLDRYESRALNRRIQLMAKTYGL